MSISFRVNPEYAQISEIIPGLFICGVSSLTGEEMKKNKITHIINATNEVSFQYFPYKTLKFQVPNLRSLGDIQRTKLWLEDTPQTYIYPHLELQSDQVSLFSLPHRERDYNVPVPCDQTTLYTHLSREGEDQSRMTLLFTRENLRGGGNPSGRGKIFVCTFPAKGKKGQQ